MGRDERETASESMKEHRDGRPYSVLLRLVVALLIAHFEHEPTVNQKALEEYDRRIIKRVLAATGRQLEVRQELGTDDTLWPALTDLFHVAVPNLTEKCFVPKAAENVNEYDAASSRKIVANHKSLLQDLPRLQDIVSIARNALTIGEVAQNAAAKAQLDAALFDLITLCIKVTARGFSSEGSQAEEEKWQSVIEEFKKLLVRCLQFVNNLVAQNERRKLMLWVELFDTSTEGAFGASELPKMMENINMDDHNEEIVDIESESKENSAAQDIIKQPAMTTPVSQETATDATKSIKELLANPFLLYFGSIGTEVRKELEKQDKTPSAMDIATECKRRWDDETEESKQEWVALYTHLTERSKELGLNTPDGSLPAVDFAPSSGFNLQAANETLRSIADQLMSLQDESSVRQSRGLSKDNKQGTKIGELAKEVNKEALPFSAFVSILDDGKYVPMSSDVPGPDPDNDYYKMTCTPRYGFDVLERGKLDLLRRLEPETDKVKVSIGQDPPISADLQHSAQQVQEQSREQSQENQENQGNQAVQAEPTQASEDESEDDYSDAIPGDNNRGLLTDVPLVLGPGEVEVLPMIIQSAIVPPEDATKPGYGDNPAEVIAIKNMHIVRCHLLLAQDNGRNLLRELLIFIAAWDLREDELYFKLMSNIMQSILLNGLMPFSYHGFRETKDIVSPAQAVIMKLLTGIFRKRQSAALKAEELEANTKSPNIPGNPSLNESYPTKLEVHMVNFLFTEFRRAIIPQTCALIFLQGKIRRGIAGPEDFPLNLWDMERMYEGIYQYLEFLAILTEHRTWKVMMSEWDITSELITLLEELNTAIPRSTLKSQQALKQFHEQNPGAADSYHTPHGPAEEEPCNFEWRNLKKLAVLVLSSMVWHNPRVQQQLGAADSQRRPGRGIRALLNCCKIDDFNPYIKEHAVMALRFALEECLENQQIVKNLRVPESLVPAANAQQQHQAQMRAPTVTPQDNTGEKYILDGVEVPKEVLDLNGYETFVDNGNVQLRKRPATSPH